MLKSTLLVAGIVAGVLMSAPAIAGPTTPLKADVPAAEPLVTQVHGCHRDAQLGPFGWHFHGRGCQRIATARPRPRYVAPPPPPRAYQPPGYYDPRPYRPRPVCVQECNYIGPIRQCRTVCR